ncbi:MAG: phenylalanine--tRNA ligase subunit beta [Candidatus Saccharimonadales bacterium]
MIISLNWIKKFTDIDIDTNQLIELIGSRLVEVESVLDLNEKYKDVLVAKVIEASNIEGSDHLRLTKIDDNGVYKDVDRDENGLIQVVCGANNVKAGQLIAWLPPQSTVPETYGQIKPYVLDSRTIYGFLSNGMIASAKELDLFDEHDGILVLDEDLKPGDNFAKAYELDDYLLDIENKSLTHRPDCFGVIGFAREVSAILGKEFKSPNWFLDLKPNINSTNQFEINVAILDYELSDRYQAVTMSSVDGSKKTPLLIQTYLSRVGVRPINVIVDITNYLMILSGQPLHAFDYDKFISIAGEKAEILVRAGKKDEKLELLDEKVIELTPEDIVISAGETAVALAGAMGGVSTSIDENTKNIIIESATFNLYKLRATQMRHGIFSEAITRFTKGQPPDLTAPVLAKATELLSEWAGASVSSNVADYYANKKDQKHIKVPLNLANSVLGTDFSIKQLIDPLCRAEFQVDVVAPYTVDIISPWWRSDINIQEDVIEEIGRLDGFDNIKPTLPVRDFKAVMPHSFDNFREQIRNILVKSGANEILSYSFIHGDILRRVFQDESNSYKIVNSISPNLQYYRQSLTPSLLDLVHPNIKQGYDEFAIFELNKTHSKKDGLNDESVPVERDSLALVYASKNDKSGSPYYQVKHLLEYLFSKLNLQLSFEPIDSSSDIAEASPFEPIRTAKLLSLSGKTLGYLGEYKKTVCKNFKLPPQVAGFEINTQLLFNEFNEAKINYQPVSKYPSTDRDLCFKVENDVTYEKIINSIQNSLNESGLNYEINPVDIYQSASSSTKNVTIRIKLNSYDKTLTNSDINPVIDKVVSSVIALTNAILV